MGPDIRKLNMYVDLQSPSQLNIISMGTNMILRKLVYPLIKMGLVGLEGACNSTAHKKCIEHIYGHTS